MNIKRVNKKRKITIVPTLSGLTDAKAQRIFCSLFAEFAKDYQRPRLIVLEGGRNREIKI